MQQKKSKKCTYLKELVSDTIDLKWALKCDIKTFDSNINC